MHTMYYSTADCSGVSVIPQGHYPSNFDGACDGTGLTSVDIDGAAVAATYGSGIWGGDAPLAYGGLSTRFSCGWSAPLTSVSVSGVTFSRFTDMVADVSSPVCLASPTEAMTVGGCQHVKGSNSSFRYSLVFDSRTKVYKTTYTDTACSVIADGGVEVIGVAGECKLQNSSLPFQNDDGLLNEVVDDDGNYYYYYHDDFGTDDAGYLNDVYVNDDDDDDVIMNLHQRENILRRQKLVQKLLLASTINIATSTNNNNNYDDVYGDSYPYAMTENDRIKEGPNIDDAYYSEAYTYYTDDDGGYAEYAEDSYAGGPPPLEIGVRSHCTSAYSNVTYPHPH